MPGLAHALAEAGGAGAPPQATAQLRALLEAELAHGRAELPLARAGYGSPVLVAFAATAGALLAAVPVDSGFRADPEVAGERSWRVCATVVGALVAGGADGALTAAPLGSGLLLRAAAAEGVGVDAELAVLAYDDALGPADRLRTHAVLVPAAVLAPSDPPKAPIGRTHPLLVARELARLDADPAGLELPEAVEDAVLQALGADRDPGATRPHDDPHPSRRVARRILQRLDGMGKWGGYHTAFEHLSRGFAPAERHLAAEVGEALLRAGLLSEKQSVGQRHVFLNPRRAADIRALIEDGTTPADLRLP